MTSYVHLVPTATARGAQVYARALADVLDTPQARHLVLSLFEGPPGVRVDEVVGRSRGRTPGVGFDPLVVPRLRSSLSRLAPAAVVAHGGDALKYAAWAKGSRPLVYYAIGTLAPVATGGLRREAWRILTRRADVVAAVSDDVAEECRTVLGVPAQGLVVVPNGRDPSVFHPAAASEVPSVSSDPLVIFVGRMVSGKRPQEFVRLVSELRRRGFALRAAAVGDGPLLSGLRQNAASAGVDLVGPSDDVASIMRSADLFVFPSAPEGEGMPGVLIEAGLSAIPVVATSVAGVSTVVEDGRTGMVVGVHDFEGLLSATASLLEDPVRRRSMGEAARARCSELFTMEKSAARWKDLFGELAERI